MLIDMLAMVVVLVFATVLVSIVRKVLYTPTRINFLAPFDCAIVSAVAWVGGLLAFAEFALIVGAATFVLTLVAELVGAARRGLSSADHSSYFASIRPKKAWPVTAEDEEWIARRRGDRS